MRNPKSSLDRVITSVPQDATAARVTSKGTHYAPAIKYGDVDHRDIRPPVILPEQMGNPQGTAFARTIIGKRMGRLTVIGLAAEQTGKAARGKGNKRWVVRCDCGAYEFRKAKTITQDLDTDKMCRDCHDLEWKKEQYKKLGAKPISEFIGTPEEGAP